MVMVMIWFQLLLESSIANSFQFPPLPSQSALEIFFSPPPLLPAFSLFRHPFNSFSTPLFITYFLLTFFNFLLLFSFPYYLSSSFLPPLSQLHGTGSYHAISGGHIHEALLDLTGAPCHVIDFSDPAFSSEETWYRTFHPSFCSTAFLSYALLWVQYICAPFFQYFIPPYFTHLLYSS